MTQTDLGSLILIHITPKERTLSYAYVLAAEILDSSRKIRELQSLRVNKTKVLARETQLRRLCERRKLCLTHAPGTHVEIRDVVALITIKTLSSNHL